jgi:hypothetical protein
MDDNIEKLDELALHMALTYRVVLKRWADQFVYRGHCGEHLKRLASDNRIVYQDHRSKGAYKGKVAWFMLSEKEAARRGVKDRAKLKNAGIQAANQITWSSFAHKTRKYRLENSTETEPLLGKRIPANVAFVITTVGKEVKRPVLLRVLCTDDDVTGIFRRTRAVCLKLRRRHKALTDRKLLGVLVLVPNEKKAKSVRTAFFTKTTPSTPALVDEFFVRVEFAPRTDRTYLAIQELNNG